MRQKTGMVIRTTALAAVAFCAGGCVYGPRISDAGPDTYIATKPGYASLGRTLADANEHCAKMGNKRPC